MSRLELCAIALAVSVPLAIGAQTRMSSSAEIKAIIGATVVNLDGGSPIKDAVLVVEGERIAAVGPAATTKVPQDAQLIRAAGKWIIPGLMNMHVHLGLIWHGMAAAELATESEAALALRMAANARAALNAGVTTVRLVGERAHTDLALKRAIDNGQTEGPRIFTAGRLIIPTGGHGGGKSRDVEADGPAEFRKAVRREIQAGVGWIKISITGGIGDERGNIGASHMTPDELQAVIDVAHRHGIKVTAHAGSSAATAEAVDAHIDCIEHGYELTDEVARQMVRHGTALVPTILVSRPAVKELAEKSGAPAWYVARVTAVGEQHWMSLRTAVKAGVKIVLGTDYLPTQPFDGTVATIREAEWYVEAGMTPLQALRAATIEPASLLGVAAQLGSLEKGKLADLIFVDRDPTRDISALRTIGFVMKGGTVVRHDESSPRRDTDSQRLAVPPDLR